jgi:tRNA 2-selenouridine synthase
MRAYLCATLMIENLSVDKFMSRNTSELLLLDVRSPSEYDQGHIPGARSFALFSDAERAAIGTTFKQIGPEEAVTQGLDFVAPRMSEMIRNAQAICKDRPVVLHCWRGGKRSGSVAWLLDFAGMHVSVMEGGYKAYRNYQKNWLENSRWNFIILGGKTGSGKTDLLHALKASGEQVLDLEGLANHKGSAFGWIGEDPQPSSEHYENLVAHALMQLDPKRRIWVENESRSVGKVFIPDPVWSTMCLAPLVHLEIPLETRVHNLVHTYVDGDNKAALIASFEKIQKRLGGQYLTLALESLAENNFATAAEVALTYYDKTYTYGLEKRKRSTVFPIDGANLSREELVAALKETADTLSTKSNAIPSHPI